ncbi:MAG: energy transducer TonB [Candidatus Tyrphobacter sp.]
MEIQVFLDASGAVTNAKIIQDSPDRDLDVAALRVAYSSVYAPRVENCVNLPDTYL